MVCLVSDGGRARGDEVSGAVWFEWGAEFAVDETDEALGVVGSEGSRHRASQSIVAPCSRIANPG